jgi:hypothetical protein
MSLSSVTFESGSALTRIEANAFSNCSSLQSIWLPPSVEVAHLRPLPIRQSQLRTDLSPFPVAS